MATKIRTIKPALFRHEQLFDAEIETGLPLRVAFAGLFCCCDAAGRFEWRPRQLKLDILPYDSVEMDAVLAALHANGFVVKYLIDNKVYGCIPTWLRHQRINAHEAASNLPACTDKAAVIVSMKGAVSHDEVEFVFNDDDDPEDDPPTGSSAIENPSLIDDPYPVIGMESNEPVEDDFPQKVANLKILDKCDKHHSISEVETIFFHWQRTMGYDYAQLDEARKRLIRAALKKGYSVDDLCAAISGCRKTPHNCGDNDRGERYDSLRLILSSSDQIDRFIRNNQTPPKRITKAEREQADRLKGLHDWCQTKVTQGASYESTSI